METVQHVQHDALQVADACGPQSCSTRVEIGCGTKISIQQCLPRMRSTREKARNKTDDSADADAVVLLKCGLCVKLPLEDSALSTTTPNPPATSSRYALTTIS
jgi:hypothetical protein